LFKGVAVEADEPAPAPAPAKKKKKAAKKGAAAAAPGPDGDGDYSDDQTADSTNGGGRLVAPLMVVVACFSWLIFA
nr:hypothetical protein [Tanacetum cinerariifolium]